MKIFLDTAHVKSIEQWAATGILDGVTTNPTSLSKEGGNPREIVREICKILPRGEISVEVTEEEPEKLYAQALKIAELSSNILVKVPCHVHYYPVIKKLVQQGIKLNITLVFSLMQGLMMSKLNVVYISPFVGRLEDNNIDAQQVLPELRQMVDEYMYQTKILAASMRSIEHLEYAVRSGADAITMSAELLQKATSHLLTDKGIAQFAADWKKTGVSNFP